MNAIETTLKFVTLLGSWYSIVEIFLESLSFVYCLSFAGVRNHIDDQFVTYIHI